MTNSGIPKRAEAADATAKDYVAHAKAINAIARTTLQLETRGATSLEAKISLGLSLQAGELAGKGILRALGHSVQEIRNTHGRHDLLTLLRQASKELQTKSDKELASLHDFLLRTIAIDGAEYATTIGEYLKLHFSHGAPARPRSYFYPDEFHFTAPTPIHALLLIIDELIEVAAEVVRELGRQDSSE